jgi:hypothetical protein
MTMLWPTDTLSDEEITLDKISSSKIRHADIIILNSKNKKPAYSIWTNQNGYPPVYYHVPILKKNATHFETSDFKESEAMKNIVYRYQTTVKITEMEISLHFYQAEESSEIEIKEMEDSIWDSIWDF